MVSGKDSKDKDSKESLDNNSKQTELMLSIARYVFGLIFLFTPAVVLFLKGANVTFIIIGMVMPPVAFIVDPPIITGVYFMLTSKYRWRFDVTAILLSIICLVLLFTMQV